MREASPKKVGMEVDMLVEEHIFTEVYKEGELYLPETFVITCGRLTLRKSPTEFDPHRNKDYVTDSRNSQPNIVKINESKININKNNRLNDITDGVQEIKHHDYNDINEGERNSNFGDVIEKTMEQEQEFDDSIKKENIYEDETNLFTEVKEQEKINLIKAEKIEEISEDIIRTTDEETKHEKLESQIDNKTQLTSGNLPNETKPKEQKVKKRDFSFYLQEELETLDEESDAMDEQLLTKDHGEFRQHVPVIEEPGERKRFRGLKSRRMEMKERKIVKNTVVIEEIHDNLDCCQYEEVLEPIVDEELDVEEITTDTMNTVDITELNDEIKDKQEDETLKHGSNPEKKTFTIDNENLEGEENILDEDTVKITTVITNKDEWEEHKDSVTSMTVDDVTEADDFNRCAEVDEREVVREILEEYGSPDSGEHSSPLPWFSLLLLLLFLPLILRHLLPSSSVMEDTSKEVTKKTSCILESYTHINHFQ